ncbi:MAG: DUF4237 domain-containing protein [Actinophytocola sp.]|nr:DUF4237 domain-containing protein [Actinophytocola sp.]
MGIELPRELADIAARTGVRWPEADEDAMREQARAWRDAASQLTTLAGDADAAATAAFDGMSGEGATAARTSWSRVIDAGDGELGRASRGATEAADRLEHAAGRIAATKVEMVRQLTETARQVDAANAAAGGGHPDALAGVSTLLGKTSADLDATANTLVSDVADPVRCGAGLGGGESVVDVPDEAIRDVGDTVSALTDAEPPGAADDDVANDARGGAADVVEDATGAPGNAPDDVSPTAPTPPSGVPGAGHPYADVPTPPSGFPAGAGAPGVLPRGAYPGGQPMPPIDGSTGLAGYADAPAMPPPAPSAPSAGPGPVGGPPAGYNAPGAGMGAAPLGGAAPPAHGHVAGQAPPAQPGHGAHQPAQPAPQPTQQPSQRPAPPPQADPQASTGTPRKDRDSVVALFLVHMFPIGHLPVPASAPAYQLPPQDDEADFATGLRFPPHDHPQSHLIDPGDPPEPGGGADQAVRGLPAEHPAVADLCDDVPLVAANGEDWHRRFVVARDSTRAEYVWPPGELYPEGCCEHGEPIVLPVGTVIDRFGDEHGRVFAADRTSYAARSLPPARLDSGYHRYRVLRELPVWAAESATWFGQPGGGLRYRAVYPVTDLIALGYLAGATPSAEAAANTGTTEPSETGEGT